MFSGGGGGDAVINKLILKCKRKSKPLPPESGRKKRENPNDGVNICRYVGYYWK